MCQCFGGKPVEFENLRTPEQQSMMKALYRPIAEGMGGGATQFPGQLSAGQTAPQQAALQAMMGIGGFPNYIPGQANMQSFKAPSVTTGKGPGATSGKIINPKFGNLDPYNKSGGMAGKTGNIVSGQPGGMAPAEDLQMAMMLLGLLSGQGGSPYDPRNIMGQ